MSVRATIPGTNPNWIVFALTNTTDKSIERWLTADRYTVVGSGTVWPDLDARRIEGVTPSVGFVPERIKNDRADVFRITLEPGQTITYVAELSSDRFARVYPVEGRSSTRSRAATASSSTVHAGPHRPARDLSDRHFRRQPQGHLPDRGALHVVRARLSLRRLRLLPQAVQLEAGGQRDLSRRQRSRDGRELRHLPLDIPAARAVARLRPHADRRVDGGAA